MLHHSIDSIHPHQRGFCFLCFIQPVKCQNWLLNEESHCQSIGIAYSKFVAITFTVFDWKFILYDSYAMIHFYRDETLDWKTNRHREYVWGGFSPHVKDPTISSALIPRWIPVHQLDLYPHWTAWYHLHPMPKSADQHQSNALDIIDNIIEWR